MCSVTWNRFPIKTFADKYTCVAIVETNYLNTDQICASFNDCKAKLSSKAYSEPGASNCFIPPYNIHDRCSLWCELVKLNSDAIVRFCIFKRFLDMQVSLQNRVRRGKHEAGLVSTASSPLAVHNRKRDTVRAGGGHNVSLSQQSHLPHP